MFVLCYHRHFNGGQLVETTPDLQVGILTSFIPSHTVCLSCIVSSPFSHRFLSLSSFLFLPSDLHYNVSLSLPLPVSLLFFLSFFPSSFLLFSSPISLCPPLLSLFPSSPPFSSSPPFLPSFSSPSPSAFSPLPLSPHPQYGTVQYGLVTINSPSIAYRQACSYYPVTCDPLKLVQWLGEVR